MWEEGDLNKQKEEASNYYLVKSGFGSSPKNFTLYRDTPFTSLEEVRSAIQELYQFKTPEEFHVRIYVDGVECQFRNSSQLKLSGLFRSNNYGNDDYDLRCFVVYDRPEDSPSSSPSPPREPSLIKKNKNVVKCVDIVISSSLNYSSTSLHSESEVVETDDYHDEYESEEENVVVYYHKDDFYLYSPENDQVYSMGLETREKPFSYVICISKTEAVSKDMLESDGKFISEIHFDDLKNILISMKDDKKIYEDEDIFPYYVRLKFQLKLFYHLA